MSDRQWYYLDNGRVEGPLDQKRFVEIIQLRNLDSHCLTWTDGLKGWTPLSNIKGYDQVVRPIKNQKWPPPPPPPPGKELTSIAFNGRSRSLYIPRPEPRSLILLALLSIITLGLIQFYLMYAWAKEINGLYQEKRHNPILAFIISLITLGLATLVYLPLFVCSVEEWQLDHKVKRHTSALWFLILLLDIICNVISFIFWPAGIVVMVLICIIVQHQFNKAIYDGLDKMPEPNYC